MNGPLCVARAMQRKETAAEEIVRCRTVRERSVRFVQPGEIRFIEMYAVRVHRPASEQPKVCVHIEIARVTWIQRADPLDFGDVLRHVRMDVGAWRLAPQ